jgi:hypothetical protein
MSKILKKIHLYEGKRTFMELYADGPKLNERGYTDEGHITVRMGDETGVKAAFKLSMDEARAVRDLLNLSLKEHDQKIKELFSREESYSPPQPQVDFSSSTSIFGSNEPEKEEKGAPEFYY